MSSGTNYGKPGARPCSRTLSKDCRNLGLCGAQPRCAPRRRGAMRASMSCDNVAKELRKSFTVSSNRLAYITVVVVIVVVYVVCVISYAYNVIRITYNV